MRESQEEPKTAPENAPNTPAKPRPRRASSVVQPPETLARVILDTMDDLLKARG